MISKNLGLSGGCICRQSFDNNNYNGWDLPQLSGYPGAGSVFDLGTFLTNPSKTKIETQWIDIGYQIYLSFISLGDASEGRAAGTYDPNV